LEQAVKVSAGGNMSHVKRSSRSIHLRSPQGLAKYFFAGLKCSRNGTGAVPAVRLGEHQRSRRVHASAMLLCRSILFACLFLLIAGGAIWRLFTRDYPALPSFRTAAYYVALLLSLGLILRSVPGELFGH
jgi:hypothetical protein